MEPKQALYMAMQVADALEHAHANKLVHRDVKPLNVLIQDGLVAKLTDFGLVRATEEEDLVEVGAGKRERRQMRQSSLRMGTIEYMSPEQFDRADGAEVQIGPASDVWSLGVMLLKLLTGEHPSAGTAAPQLLEKKRRQQSLRERLWWRPLWELVEACLAWEPSARPTVEQVGQRLRELYPRFAKREAAPPKARPRPETAEDLSNRALSMVDLRNPRQALPLWSEALQKDPKHLPSAFNQALCKYRHRLGFPWEGWREAEPILSNGSGWDYERAAGLVMTCSPEAAQIGLNIAGRLLQDHRATPAVLNLAGAAQLILGQHDEAQARLREALALDSSYWWAAWNLAASLVQTGRQQEAITLLATKEVLGDVFAGFSSPADALRAVRAGTIGLVSTGEPHEGAASGEVISPDGRLLATTGELAAIKSRESGDVLWFLAGHTNWVNSVAFSPDGRYVASGSKDNTVRLWDANSGECVKVLEGHTDYVNSVAFSPDGRYVASGSSDRTVRLWDTNSGECVWVLEGHTASVTYVEFREGGWLLFSSDEKEGRFWDVSGLYVQPPQIEVDYILCRPSAL